MDKGITIFGSQSFGMEDILKLMKEYQDAPRVHFNDSFDELKSFTGEEFKEQLAEEIQVYQNEIPKFDLDPTIKTRGPKFTPKKKKRKK